MGCHGAVASKALGDKAKIERILEDYTTAPIDARLRATLDLLKKVMHEPSAVVPEDVAEVRRAGASDEQIDDALHVLYLFSIYTRCADALGFEMPKDGYRMARVILLNAGYR
jgi:alkylhydroperoxidase family enzyme